MPISVRLPSRVEQELSDYCVSHKVTKSKASAGFRGSDKTVGDVARHSKRLLRERFRNRTSLG